MVATKLKCALLIIAVILSLSASGYGEQTDSNQPLAASHIEIGSIGNTPETEFGRLVSFCMDSKGRLLACDVNAAAVRLISPDGDTLDECKLVFCALLRCRARQERDIPRRQLPPEDSTATL